MRDEPEASSEGAEVIAHWKPEKVLVHEDSRTVVMEVESR